MKTHFRRIIWPVTVGAALLGFALFEYTSGKPRRFLNLFYATVMCSTYIAICLMRIIWYATAGDMFMVDHLMTLCCCLTVLLSIGFSHWNGKRYHTCLEQFSQVDETLAALGIQTDYAKLYRVVVVGVVTWVIGYFLVVGSDYEELREEDPEKTIVPVLLLFAFNIPSYAPVIVHMNFWAVLGYAGTIFDYLSSTLSNCIPNNNDPRGFLRNRKNLSVPGIFVAEERKKHIIWTVMHLHFRLCEIVGGINQVFEAQITIQMGFACIFILTSIIYTLRIILVSDDVAQSLVIGGTIWTMTLPYLVEIILTNHLCESILAKARTVSDMVVVLLPFVDDEILREDVTLVVLRTKHRPLRISSRGLYHFGYQFMFEIFSSIITMTVIVLQENTGLERWKPDMYS